VIIMKLLNRRSFVIKSKEFVLLWIELKDAADAHKALDARATSGSTVLTIEPTLHRSFP
jgi:hypothetical protein